MFCFIAGALNYAIFAPESRFIRCRASSLVPVSCSSAGPLLTGPYCKRRARTFFEMPSDAKADRKHPCGKIDGAGNERQRLSQAQ